MVKHNGGQAVQWSSNSIHLFIQNQITGTGGANKYIHI